MVSGHSRRGSQVPHSRHSEHAETFRRRFWLSLFLSIPVIATSPMIMHWFGYTLEFSGVHTIGPVLGTVVFAYGGWPFLTGGVSEARTRKPGMMLLVAMAITVAFVASLATSFGQFDLDFWWELAALVTIMLLGHWQEMKAVGQARGALDALSALLPDEAERMAPDGSIRTVGTSELAVGDVLLVRSGARVPADGQIVRGTAELDESMVTGESRPARRETGDRVVAGTVATDSAIRLRVTAVGENTALAGIQRLVEQAQRSRGRAQVLADRFAALLFYLATAVGALTLAAWWLLDSLGEAVVRTVTVLVIACPHALGLAIPLVIALSTAVAAKNGILVKSRLALERTRTVDAVLFDKTGTLTTGQHSVSGVVTTGHIAEDEALAIAGAVEADSEHPLAKAIVRAASRQATSDGARPIRATEFRSSSGRGVLAVVHGVRHGVGGPAMLRELGTRVPEELMPRIEDWQRRGATVLYLVRRDRPVAAFALQDTVRPEAAEAVAQLRKRGVEQIAMITGDARPVADAVAADLGIDEVFAEVLPADKDTVVADLQRRGYTVAMVGDGVNDAPALARADVGMAIGAGTDVAIESAGIVLARSDPRAVAAVIGLSAASYRKMRQNLGWAAGYNVVALPLAAGVLAWAGISLSPAVGAVLMSLSTIVVASNAQTLRRVRLGTGAPASS